jgi:multidrug efflux pump
VREYPKIDEPVVTVSVRYAGASAEVIETQVTKPLEDSIAGIDAVDVLTSISRPEQAQISVRFRLEKDADTAAAEVRDRVSRVRNKLPQTIEEPVIAKVEADAFPVIWLAFSSDTRSRAGDQRPGQPHRQGAPADRDRRGRRAHLRRAQVRHARVAGPGQAGRYR